MTPPPSTKVFIAGVSGSGKSTAAWEYWLRPFPRRLLIDATGEYQDRADVVTFDAPDTIDAVLELAPRGRWTIAAAIDPDDDLPQLVDWLMPLPELHRSPVVALGGAVLLIDEADLAAPPGDRRKHLRNLFRRGRHIGLSIVATTQRPESVSREVSSQCPQALLLRLVEPAALEYMRTITQLPPAAVQALRRYWEQHPHGGLWLDRSTGRQALLTESRRWVAGAQLRQLLAGAGAPVVPGPDPDPDPARDDDADDDDPPADRRTS